MKRTLFFCGLGAMALWGALGCNGKVPSNGNNLSTDSLKTPQAVCSTDDTLSGKQAAEMIADWDSVTEDLPINNRVSILATYLKDLLKDDKDYPTLRIYLGLVPTAVDDSLNIGLIAMQVDTNCNDRANQSSYLLFTGTSGDSLEISDSLADAYIHAFVTTIYGLPQFEAWPEIKAFGFSVDYITSILRYGQPGQKIEANFAVRDYRCEQVEWRCGDGKKTVNGIDVILQQYQMIQPKKIDVQKVAINFSVPCPRFCGVAQEAKSLQ